MSLWNLITGTTPDAEQQAGLDYEKQQYDAALARRQAAGTITPEQVAADQAYENGISLESTDAGAAQGFKEGLQEGLDNVLAAPGKAVGLVGKGAGDVLGNVLKNIPWWVYLGAAVAAFFYFGGLAILLRPRRA